MSIRTVIEITAPDELLFERELRAVLDRLGFEPKQSPHHIRFMGDLFREMADRGLKPEELVEAQRAKARAA